MNFILLFISFLTVFCLIMTGYAIAVGSWIGIVLTIFGAFASMGIGFVIKRKLPNA